MLIQPTFDKLHALRLRGMARAFEEQLSQTDIASLSFEERFGLIVDAQWLYRENRALERRLKKAQLSGSAAFEDINFRLDRKLDRSVIRSLGTCQWIVLHQNVFITGKTGIGKSFLCRALLEKACREGYSAYYARGARFFRELDIAQADGSYDRMLTRLAKTDVLAIDDWAMVPLTDSQRRHFLEVLDDRYGSRSTVLVSQYPSKEWYDRIGNPTLADAILDRLVHNAHKIELDGKSIREHNGLLTAAGQVDNQSSNTSTTSPRRKR